MQILARVQSLGLVPTIEWAPKNPSPGPESILKEGERFMPNQVGTQIARAFDWVVCKTAGITFDAIQFFNKRNPNPSVTPKWSDKPLLKSWEKTKPTLGFPRQTDSLCPACVKEAREAIIAG